MLNNKIQLPPVDYHYYTYIYPEYTLYTEYKLYLLYIKIYQKILLKNFEIE